MSDPGEIFDIKLSIMDIVVLRRIILRTSMREMRAKKLDSDDILRIQNLCDKFADVISLDKEA